MGPLVGGEVGRVESQAAAAGKKAGKCMVLLQLRVYLCGGLVLCGLGVQLYAASGLASVLFAPIALFAWDRWLEKRWVAWNLKLRQKVWKQLRQQVRKQVGACLPSVIVGMTLIEGRHEQLEQERRAGGCMQGHVCMHYDIGAHVG